MNESEIKKQEFAIPAVGAAILNNERKIFLMKSSGKFGDEWIIPGGKINFGESMVEALKREIREETGIECEGCEFLGVREYIYEKRHFIFLEFLAYSKEGCKITLNEEATEYGWFSKSELSQINIAKPTWDFLKERILHRNII